MEAVVSADQELRPPVERETEAEKKLRYRSIRIAHLTMFTFSVGFSVVLTGVYPYLKELYPEMAEETLLKRYGWVVSINPLGQMIAAPLFGYLYQKTGSARLVGLITSVAYILGNILYAILSVFPQDYRYGLMLLSRFIVGASAGNIATVRSYIAAATFTSERTAQMSMASSFQSIGFVLGPGIQAALTPLQCTDVASSSAPSSYISFDMYTAAGWVSAFLGLLSFLLFLPFIFKEVDVSLKERQYAALVQQQGKDKNAKAGNEQHNQDHLPKADALAAIVCVLTFFTYIFNFVLIETLGTPMCMDQFGWTEEETVLKFGILLGALGFVSIFLFASVGPLCRKFDERKILIFLGIFFMFLGRLFVFPIPGWDLPPLASDNSTLKISAWDSQQFWKSFSSNYRNVPCQETTTISPGCALEWCKTMPALTLWQLFGGMIIGAIGYPYCIAITQSIFSKILGPRPQGLWMGLLSAFGSFSRVLGPIIVSSVYRLYGTYWTTGIMTISMILALVAVLAFYRRLVPLEIVPLIKAENEDVGNNTASSTL